MQGTYHRDITRLQFYTTQET